MWNSSMTLWSSWWSCSNKKDDITAPFITILTAIVAVFWFRRIFKKSRKPVPPLPPGPRGLPLVGYLPFLESNLHSAFTELATSYGPVYKLRLGTKLCVVLSSEETVKEAVRDQDIVFSNGDPSIYARIVTYGGDDVAFAQYGPEWKKLRKLFVRELLSNANLDNSYDLRKEEVKNSISFAYEKKGSPVDIGELGFSTSINAVISMIFDCKIRLLEEEGSHTLLKLKEAAAQNMVLIARANISDLFPVLARFDIQGIEKQGRKISGLC